MYAYMGSFTMSIIKSITFNRLCGPLGLIVFFAAILVLLVFTCGLFLLRVSCVRISLLLVIIHISGLDNMPLLAENINLATFILCTYFSFRSFICLNSGSVWSL